MKRSDGTLDRVERPKDGKLRGRKYYSRLGSRKPDGEALLWSTLVGMADGVTLPDQYPVDSSFDHWRFPHGNIPRLWSDLDIPPSPSPPILKQRSAVLGRDGGCCISGYTDDIEVAHLVPRSAGHWFSSSDMKR